jgi:antitoxin (DNA-binding transcriptional repressor) of toxin-antitoxin stability system
MGADRAFTFGSRPVKNGDGPNSNTGSSVMDMRSVVIKLLKNKLSEYIRLAAGGETVLVADRGRVVAELGPPAPGRSPLVSDALLLDAVRRGWIRPPLSAGGEMPARKPVMTLHEISADLQQGRADR